MFDSESLLQKRKQIKSIFQDTQVSILRSLIPPDKKVLEIGCGYGFFLEMIGKYSGQAVGIEKYLDPAGSVLNNKDIKFVKADAVKLPFRNESFDFVYSVDVIEHIDNDSEFVKESLRVLKKNGTIIIGTPNRDRLSARIKKLLFRPNKYPLVIKDKIFGTVTHIREYKRSELIYLLSGFNAEIQTIIPVYLGLTDILPVGLKAVPKFLENLCQFWFVTAKKI